MGLETFTFISSFNAANPVGATDPKSAGDNHIRGMKAAILATFAAITGAVTASHTELNNLTGVTGKTGTGNLVLSASPTLTGTVTAGTVNASSLGTSPLNASNLSSGTVPDARFPATLPAASGVNLTALNASNIASGSLADARLSANVPLINAANTFTSTNGISAGNINALGTYTSTNANGVYFQYNVNGVAKGYIGAGAALGGSTDNNSIAIRAEGNLQLLAGGSATRLTISSAGNFDFGAGTVTNTGASSQQVGFNGIPNVGVTSSDYTMGTVLALAEANWSVGYNGSGGNTFTIPANATRAWAIGTTFHFFNVGSGAVSIALTSDTLRLAGTATTGTRSLAANGFATAEKVATTTWLISGPGLT
jgi:hypothetical protein